MTKNLLKPSIIFAALVTVAFGYGIYEAFSYAYLAKIFPLYISLVLFVLGIVNLIQEIRPSSKGAKTAGTGTADLETQWDITMAEVFSKFLAFVAMILILYAFTWLIGYPLSITIFIIVFYRYLANSKWYWAVVAGLTGLGFLALVSKLLYMDWPEGMIHLPWPLG